MTRDSRIRPYIAVQNASLASGNRRLYDGISSGGVKTRPQWYRGWIGVCVTKTHSATTGLETGEGGAWGKLSSTWRKSTQQNRGQLAIVISETLNRVTRHAMSKYILRIFHYFCRSLTHDQRLSQPSHIVPYIIQWQSF